MTLSAAPQTRAVCSATASRTAWELPGALASARRIWMVAASCSRTPAGPGIVDARALRIERGEAFRRDAIHGPPGAGILTPHGTEQVQAETLRIVPAGAPESIRRCHGIRFRSRRTG